MTKLTDEKAELQKQIDQVSSGLWLVDRWCRCLPLIIYATWILISFCFNYFWFQLNAQLKEADAKVKTLEAAAAETPKAEEAKAEQKKDEEAKTEETTSAAAA